MPKAGPSGRRPRHDEHAGLCADEAWASRDTDELDIVERGLRFVECLSDDGCDELEVPSGRNFRHDAPVGRVQVGLRGNDVGEDLALGRDQRGGSFVAGSLEPEYQRLKQDAARDPST